VLRQLDNNSRGFYRTRCEEEQGAGNCRPVGVAATCPGTTAYGDFGERIDGPNGDWAQTGTAGGYVGILPDTQDSPLSLLVRYFSATSIEGSTQVWLWKDRNTLGTTGDLNVFVYDEAERVHSIQLNLEDEVNFALTDQIITPGAPGGWFRITYPCGRFGSCTYDYRADLGGRPPVQAVAYAVQFAQSSDAQLRWDAIFPAHRQYTDYQGVTE
jgi:hypothetical protein